MSNLNKVCLMGRLGRDPEARNFQSGGKVVNLRLATSERFKGKDGEWTERTEWHSVAIFNERLAEVAEKYLRKGSLVYLEGQLQTRQWEKDGEKRFSTEVVLPKFRGELVMVGPKQGNGDAGGEAEAEPRREKAAPQGGDGFGDDIPW